MGVESAPGEGSGMTIRAQYATMQAILRAMTRLFRREITGFSVERTDEGFAFTEDAEPHEAAP